MPNKDHMQDLSSQWIFEMQDLSVDKMVESVDNPRWAPKDHIWYFHDNRAVRSFINKMLA